MTFSWLLPRFGVRWFYDYFKLGGFLPLFVYGVLSALWCDRRWPVGEDEQ